MGAYTTRYNELVIDVYEEFRDLINDSDYRHKHYESYKAIKINYDIYVAMAIIDDALRLLCSDGQIYFIDNIPLYDLIDMLEAKVVRY
jgi:hypothetical protein